VINTDRDPDKGQQWWYNSLLSQWLNKRTDTNVNCRSLGDTSEHGQLDRNR